MTQQLYFDKTGEWLLHDPRQNIPPDTLETLINKTQKIKSNLLEIDKTKFKHPHALFRPPTEIKEKVEVQNYKLNISVYSGKWYFEILTYTFEEVFIGWESLEEIPRSNLLETVGGSKYSYSYQLDTGILFNDTLLTNKSSPTKSGDALGVTIDFDSKQIQFYCNNKKIGEIQNITKNTKGPFYPVISMENAKLEWNITSSQFKYPPPNGFQGLGDSIPADKVFCTRFDNAKSPPQDTLEYKSAFVEKFAKDIQPINDINLSNELVAPYVIHIANRLDPTEENKDINYLRMKVSSHLTEEILINITLDLFDNYLVTKDKQWKEQILIGSTYPYLSNLHSRTQTEIEAEKEMKLWIFCTKIKEIKDEVDPDDITGGGGPAAAGGGYGGVGENPLWEQMEALLDKKMSELDSLRSRVCQLVNNPPDVPPYERIKVDIEVLGQWRKILKATTHPNDCVKLVADIILTLSLPYEDFINMSKMDLPSIIQKLVVILEEIHENYVQLKSEFKSRTTLDSAKTDYQILNGKGKDDLKRKILTDPIYLPLFLFWSGDFNRLCKNMSACLIEFFPELKPPRKNRQGVSSPQRNNSGRSLSSSENLSTGVPKQERTPEINGINKSSVKSDKPVGIHPVSPVKQFHEIVSKKKSSDYLNTLIFGLLLAGGVGIGLYFLFKYQRFGSR